ncbi:MAG: SIS domain-containing protein [Candidatus Omnitrophota bacterium]|nr:SIS domain-containing protein [Candidatus Omnitrophota bacterium]
MENIIKKAITEHKNSLTLLAADSKIIESIASLFIERLKTKGKIFFVGNGGSAADAQHLAAELVVRFKKNRAPIAALALTTDTSVMTAAANDFSFDEIFSRQVEALANKQDVVVAISTSGNSENIIRAVKKAKDLGIVTVGFLGKDGGKLKSIVDVSLLIPSFDTGSIQEMHILAGHIICEIVESVMLGADDVNKEADQHISTKEVSKVQDLLSLKLIVKEAKSKGKTIGFTNGCFDLIHPGHIKILREAKSKGDILIVGLNSDSSVKKIKGQNRPVLDQISRQQVLESISFVDYIILFKEDTPHNLIKELRPHYLVKGEDYNEDEIIGREFVQDIYRVKLQSGHSTSQIIEKIAQ